MLFSPCEALTFLIKYAIILKVFSCLFSRGKSTPGRFGSDNSEAAFFIPLFSVQRAFVLSSEH